MRNTEDFIWTPRWTGADDSLTQVVYFRKTFNLTNINQISMCEFNVSADSRYKLYVNDVFVQEGPTKGNLEKWYFDSYNISKFLISGNNVISVAVLRYCEQVNNRNASLFRTDTPCLYVNGYINFAQEHNIDLSGSAGWKCKKEPEIRFTDGEIIPAPLHVLENSSCSTSLIGWKTPDYNDEHWDDVKKYQQGSLAISESPFNLFKRRIPYQNHEEKLFKRVMCIRDSDGLLADQKDILSDLNKFVKGEKSLNIPPHSRLSFEISAEELMTGFLKLKILSGAHSVIHIKCAESYADYTHMANVDAKIPTKNNRLDFKNGQLFGYSDTYHPVGVGTKELNEEYEPFWYRTFRFVGLSIETQDEGVSLQGISYYQDGYPLIEKTRIKTSDQSLNDIYDISLRTLKRCMDETYMDCPFFEQLQYVMDSRSQMLFTYLVSGDNRLAKQCIEDMRLSQRSDGTLNCAYPSIWSNVIPTFSIYFILMINDYMMFYADKDEIRNNLATIDNILRFFNNQLDDDNIVKPCGGTLGESRYWSFIDWAEEWKGTPGVPTAMKQGPITMESLLYVYGLQYAAKINDFVGRHDTAQEYRSQADVIISAIRDKCMGNNGLVQDGPGIKEYSVHCQIFAVLTGVFDLKDGTKALVHSVHNDNVVQCSVAMDFYLFRALEKVGRYDLTNELWDTWRRMLAMNVTTCVENETDARSDCHAWGAIALYEVPSVILGIKPLEPGFSKIQISPDASYLTSASGSVVTPKGIVKVSWTKDKDGAINLKYKVPIGVSVIN